MLRRHAPAAQRHPPENARQRKASGRFFMRPDLITNGNMILLIQSANRPQRPSMLLRALSIQEFSVDNLPVWVRESSLVGLVFGVAAQLFPIRPSPAASGKADRQIASRRCGEEKGVRSPALNSACVALGWVWFWGFGLALRLFFICPAQLPAKWIGKLLSADAGRGRACAASALFSACGLFAGMRRGGAGSGGGQHPAGINFLTRFCLSNRQTARSARQYCVGRYQFRRNLWITRPL